MENHPIENLMKSTMENLKQMVDVNTVVGDAVHSKDGSIIIPISKVCFGFASGGSEFSSKNQKDNIQKYPFGGGSGAGVSVKPVAFLVMKNDSVRLLSVDPSNTYEKLIDSVPQIMDIIKGMIGNKNTSDKNAANSTPGTANAETGDVNITTDNVQIDKD